MIHHVVVTCVSSSLVHYSSIQEEVDERLHDRVVVVVVVETECIELYPRKGMSAVDLQLESLSVGQRPISAEFVVPYQWLRRSVLSIPVVGRIPGR